MTESELRERKIADFLAEANKQAGDLTGAVLITDTQTMVIGLGGDLQALLGSLEIAKDQLLRSAHAREEALQGGPIQIPWIGGNH